MNNRAAEAPGNRSCLPITYIWARACTSQLSRRGAIALGGIIIFKCCLDLASAVGARRLAASFRRQRSYMPVENMASSMAIETHLIFRRCDENGVKWSVASKSAARRFRSSKMHEEDDDEADDQKFAGLRMYLARAIYQAASKYGAQRRNNGLCLDSMLCLQGGRRESSNFTPIPFHRGRLAGEASRLSASKRLSPLTALPMTALKWRFFSTLMKRRVASQSASWLAILSSIHRLEVNVPRANRLQPDKAIEPHSAQLRFWRCEVAVIELYIAMMIHFTAHILLASGHRR